MKNVLFAITVAALFPFAVVGVAWSLAVEGFQVGRNVYTIFADWLAK